MTPAETSPRQTFSAHRARLNDDLFDLLGPDEGDRSHAQAQAGGGPPYSWHCGMGEATDKWMNSEAVRRAIHVKPQEYFGAPWPYHGMEYSTYTHASIDLYPSLLAKSAPRPRKLILVAGARLRVASETK